MKSAHSSCVCMGMCIYMSVSVCMPISMYGYLCMHVFCVSVWGTCEHNYIHIPYKNKYWWDLIFGNLLKICI